MNNTKYSAIFWTLTILALAGGVILVNQNQDTRRSAYFAKGSLLLSLSGSAKITKNVNEEFTVPLMVNANGSEVDAVRSYICYNKNQVNLVNSTVTDNVTGLLSVISKDNILAKVVDLGNEQCLDLSLLTMTTPISPTSGNIVKLGDVKFKAVGKGQGAIRIAKEKSEIVGPNTGADKSIEIATVQNAEYEVTDTLTGTYPVLNFKMAFSGVKRSSSCGNNWSVQVIVKGQGKTSKTYTVVPQVDGNSVNKFGDVVYKVSNLQLTDAGMPSEKLSVFVKGIKHAQTKYGKDKQTDSFALLDGEINLTKDSNSPVYDFSNYPLLSGDVTGSTQRGKQDGWIRGDDFTYIKEKSLTHETVSAGGYIDSDLNGDCQVNSGDLQIFKNSLIEKQDQLY